MEQILFALSPFAVAGIVQGIKWVRARVSVSAYGRSALRALVALLSLVSVVLTSVIAGTEVDVVAVETFVESLVVFLGATGTYFLSRRRS